MNRSMRSTLIRAALAVVLLAGLAAVVGKSLLPDVSSWIVSSYALVAGAVASCALLALVVASLQFRQWILRNGGTDPQWLSLSEEPAGLVALRGRVARDEIERKPSAGVASDHR